MRLGIRTISVLLVLPALLVFVLPAASHAEEDVLRLLVWRGYASMTSKHTADFEVEIEKKYGRKVLLDIQYVTEPDDFFASVRGKRVDLITIGHDLFFDERYNFVKRKLLLPIDLRNIPNHKSTTSNSQQNEEMANEIKVYGIPIAQGTYGLAYNADLVDVAPESWKVLWDPKFRNQYLIGAHEYAFNVQTAALAFGYSIDRISDYDTLNNEEFKSHLKALARNAAAHWGAGDPRRSFKKLIPEMSLTTCYNNPVWRNVIPKVVAPSGTWKFVFPKEGVIAWMDCWAITYALADKPFLKKVAEEWINGSIGRNRSEHQNQLLREITNVPNTAGMNFQPGTPENDFHSAGESIGGTRVVLPPPLSRRDHNGMKLLWEEAMEGLLSEEEDDH